MRSESRRPAAAVIVVAALALVTGCEEEKPSGPPPGRFAAVKKDDSAVKSASRTFCEQTYPKEGDGARAFVTPPERPLPAKPKGAVASSSTGWRWVNLWATWCRPCTDEMPLLGRWRDTLANDGIDLSLELWSIDEEEAALKEWLEQKPMPGAVRWLKDEASLGPTLESFGVDKNSAIPIHLFVDARDQIRCVRVGAVHEGDFGAIKTILAGG